MSNKASDLLNKAKNGFSAFGTGVAIGGMAAMSYGTAVYKEKDKEYEGRQEAQETAKANFKTDLKRMFDPTPIEKDENGNPKSSRFQAIKDMRVMARALPDNLNRFFYGLEYLGQWAVDEICKEASDRIERELQKQYDNLTTRIGARFVVSNEVMQKFAKIKDPPTSPDAAVSWIADLVDAYGIKKYYDMAKDFIIDLPPEVIGLVNDVASIASYRPPHMDVNFDKFEIRLPKMSLGDFLSTKES